MKSRHFNRGYTLTELMITMGIIGVLAAIAVPTYNSYIWTSKLATAKQNGVTLAGFEDTYFYENETYLDGTYDPPGTDQLTAALGWTPSGDADNFKYVVTAGTCGDIKKCYTITVSLKNDPTVSQVINRP